MAREYTLTFETSDNAREVSEGVTRDQYNVTITNKSGKLGEISNTYYKKKINDIICFCETNNIFKKYREHLQEEYDSECIIMNELFETVKFNIPNLKELAIS